MAFLDLTATITITKMNILLEVDSVTCVFFLYRLASFQDSIDSHSALNIKSYPCKRSIKGF